MLAPHHFGAALLVAVSSWSWGCGWTNAPGTPRIEAHRAGAGYWPENSRRAVQAAIARGDQGLEIDIVLTKDRIPILSHDPRLNEKLCTTAQGTPLSGAVFIQDLTLAELWAGYRCGGLPNEDLPEAGLVPDTHMTLAELTAALAAAPQMFVHLDLKYAPGETPSAEEVASVAVTFWRRAALPNAWNVSAEWPEVIRAIKALDPTIEAYIGWPRFPEGESETRIALQNEARVVFGVTDLVKVVRDARADGIGIPYQLIDRHAVETLRDERIKVVVSTLNSKALIDAYCRWPVEAVITDYPELGRCR